jgi:alpha-D-ribose 1-methylphosphonate 5-triphosphate synthase subunit PhnG
MVFEAYLAAVSLGRDERMLFFCCQTKDQYWANKPLTAAGYTSALHHGNFQSHTKALHQRVETNMNHPSVKTEQFEDEFRELLPELLPEETAAIGEQISHHAFDTIRPAETGLIMVTATDCFETDFHLGEILVTTAEVELDGVRGYASILGREPEKATLAAQINALMLSGKADWLTDISASLDPVRGRVDEKCRREAALISATRVRFESMAEEK